MYGRDGTIHDLHISIYCLLDNNILHDTEVTEQCLLVGFDR